MIRNSESKGLDLNSSHDETNIKDSVGRVVSEDRFDLGNTCSSVMSDEETVHQYS